jgi:hypothetical protein
MEVCKTSKDIVLGFGRGIAGCMVWDSDALTYQRDAGGRMRKEAS